MKIVIVPVLKKLAAILVSFIPLGDVGAWFLNADFWTLIETGLCIGLFLMWFVVRFLPNFRIRTNEKSRAGRGALHQTHFSGDTENVGFRVRLWRGGLQFCKWIFAVAIADPKPSAADDLHAREGSHVRSHARGQGLEPDAGPHRSFRQVTTLAHRTSQRVRN